MAADNLRFTSDGRTYQWFGGYGAVIRSFERGVTLGTMRVIHGEEMYAYVVYPGWWRREVGWTFLEPTNERIREFREKVFGL